MLSKEELKKKYEKLYPGTFIEVRDDRIVIHDTDNVYGIQLRMEIHIN